MIEVDTSRRRRERAVGEGEGRVERASPVICDIDAGADEGGVAMRVAGPFGD